MDAERALEALRLDWDEIYTVIFDDAPGPDVPKWRAWRLGGGTMVTGTTPDELHVAIQADWAQGGRM